MLDRGTTLEDAFEAPDFAQIRLDARDRSFARALARTALRRLGDIDTILGGLTARPLPRRATAVRHGLRIAAAQILFLRTADHAAVASAVDLLKRDAATGGFAGLANAVLRRLVAERDQRLAALTAGNNTPGWLFARWRRHYGADGAAAIEAAHREEPLLDLTFRAAPDAWAEPLSGLVLPGGSMRLALGDAVETLPGFDEGAWWVQDAAAAIPAHLLGAIHGLRVADACAAPGGKTAQLAVAGAAVTALDQSGTRLTRVSDNLERLRLQAKLVEADARAYVPAEPFDAVLLDAPCSATGTIRRHPDVAWLKRPQDIASLAKVQADLLRHTAGWLRAGGTLVYSTCSLEPEEGEHQIAALLAAEPGLVLDPITAHEAEAFALNVAPEGWARTLPSDRFGSAADAVGRDGFFMARFRRTSR